MDELIKLLLKQMRDDERLIDQLDPSVKAAKERLRASRKLYTLKTGKEPIVRSGRETQLEIPLSKPQELRLKKNKRMTIAQATKLMLEEKGEPLHATEILAKLPEYGSSASTMPVVWVALSRNSKLFQNIGKNRWTLRKDASRD